MSFVNSFSGIIHVQQMLHKPFRNTVQGEMCVGVYADSTPGYALTFYIFIFESSLDVFFVSN